MRGVKDLGAQQPIPQVPLLVLGGLVAWRVSELSLVRQGGVLGLSFHLGRLPFIYYDGGGKIRPAAQRALPLTLSLVFRA